MKVEERCIEGKTNTDINSLITSIPIMIATITKQNRKHHKKRINKKFKKKYGYCETNLMPHDQIIMMNDTIWMTQKTYNNLKYILKR